MSETTYASQSGMYSKQMSVQYCMVFYVSHVFQLLFTQVSHVEQDVVGYPLSSMQLMCPYCLPLYGIVLSASRILGNFCTFPKTILRAAGDIFCIFPGSAPDNTDEIADNHYAMSAA